MSSEAGISPSNAMSVPAAPETAAQATAPPATAPVTAAAATAAPVEQRCENCGAFVPSRYCGDCGQRRAHSVYSVWHFVGEATEDLTHADSRLWRTLSALLFRPGHLTREFLDGRRANYLPPVRLYLVLSVLFFLTSGAHFNTQPMYAPGGAAATQHRGIESGDATPHCEQIQYDGPWSARLGPALRSSCYKVSQDQGHALRAEITHTLPRALFVLLPLLALFMKLMYWRPRRYYVEHLLFFIHDASAIFLLLTLSWIAKRLIASAGAHQLIDMLVMIYLVVYLYRSVRGVYGQKHLLTALKFAALSFVYAISVSLTIAAAVLYSYLTL